MTRAAEASLDPGRIGRYEIRRERGRGAMGVVYEAFDPTLGRRVALKTVRLPYTATPAEVQDFEKRFFAEAQVAARLSHPGIVVVHDAARDPETGTLYMALEYLEGRTLAEIIGGGATMAWREALRITGRVASALHHAHANGVVHRDIKPANIMILPDGEPKIMDFGIAKVDAARLKLTMAGQLLGTPLYMSPEQALGNTVDARSDLFSLGVTAYSLLTGQHAFAAQNTTKIVARVVDDQPSPPSTLVPELPSGVNDILRRAMAKDPGDRYPDGNALAEDIEDVLAGRPLRDRRAKAGAPSTVVKREHLALDDDSPRPDLGADLDTLFSPRTVPPPFPPIATRTGPFPTPTPNDPVLPAGFASPRPVSAELARLRRSAAALGALVVAVAVGVGLFLTRGHNESPFDAPGLGPSPTVVGAPNVPMSPSPPAAASPLAAAGGPEANVVPAPESPLPSARETPREEIPVDPLLAAPTASPLPEAPPAAAPTMPLPAAPPQVAPLAAPLDQPARLTIDFEHPLESGTLKVWLDATLVVNENLNSRVSRKFLAVKVRKGRFQDVLQVNPGRYVVTVEVKGNDLRRSARLDGNLKAGSPRRLNIRLGGNKELSVAWE